MVSGQWSVRTEGAYRSAFGGISRFRLAKAYRDRAKRGLNRAYIVRISLCEAEVSAISSQLVTRPRPLSPRPLSPCS